MSIYSAVDLFAGPGGWDVAFRNLTRGHAIGIENDAAACATRTANGLLTWETDVRILNPVSGSFLSYPETYGLIASPPCQTFSMAGKGSGRAALDTVLAGVTALTRDEPLPWYEDDRTALVLEPLRWALARHRAGKPFRWIALEQVPAVLPVWEAYAGVLRELGYSVVTSVLCAEQYGVPQTRKRAVLLAHLTRDVKLPAATHRKYRKGVPQYRLYDQEPNVKPWVSTADALGWGMTERPYPAVSAGTAAGGTDPQVIGGTGARKAIRAEREAGRWIEKAHDDAPSEWQRPFVRQGTTPPLQVVENANDGARLSIHEAAVLQTFPADYVWQGRKSEQYQQVGNAIPPLLAEALLREVM